MKTVLNVKTDLAVKEEAQRLAAYMGIPLSTVVNAYLKEFIASGEFHITREPELQDSVRKEITLAIKEQKKKGVLSPSFTNAKDAIAWLAK